MPEQETPRRRRVRQVIPKEEPKEPVRIVVGAGEDKPEWMVSADNAQGAAQRRTKTGTANKKAVLKPKTEQKKQQPEQEKPKTRRKVAVVSGGEDILHVAKPGKKTTVRRKSTGKKTVRGGRKKKLTRKERENLFRKIRRWVLLAMVSAVVITLLAVAGMSGKRLMDVKKTLDKGDGVFYSNIYVNNIPLEGMTLDQAAAAVTQQVTNQLSSWRITLRTQDGRTWDITGQDLGMKYDVADQLDQLWGIGHTGTSQERYEQVQQLLEGEPIRRYTKLYYDMSKVYSILTQIKSEIDKPAISAQKVIDNTVFPPYTYTDDVPGVTLDITGLTDEICGMVDRLEAGTVDLVPTVVEAATTRKFLESQIVKLATFETAISNTSTEGRFRNVELGTSKFNHLIIKPNESVSFNKVTGKRIERNGYQEALELAYGDYRMGWGGGICQVSSTLYNAVVAAGLKITERHQHSLPSSYVDKGLDATVQDDRLDFIFQNNTGAEIFIETNYYKKKSYYYTQFTIYGRPDPNGYSYRLDSQVREVIPLPEVELRPDKDATYVVYNDQTHVYTKGEEGYIVDVYKVTLDSKGLEVARELAYTDTYKPRAPVTYVGVTPRETSNPYSY